MLSRIIRWAVLLPNILLLLGTVYNLSADNTFTVDRGFELLCLVATGGATFLILFSSPIEHSSNFLTLWLRRKAAEERKKLEELEGVAKR